jgi:PIN domain nuclease of toxin-antitoxin system
MSFLFDTHVLLWALAAPDRLGSQTQALLADPAEPIYVSSASYWEISIKFQLGKLSLPRPPGELFPSHVEAAGYSPLPILPAHTFFVAALPPHHKDPFDRMLVAQAHLENLTIITSDVLFSRYDVRVWLASK